MPGGALACVLPPERSTPGPPSRPDIAYAGLRVSVHTARPGLPQGSGHASERDAEMGLASSGYAAEYRMDRAFVAG
jgi:hypothetical protein